MVFGNKNKNKKVEFRESVYGEDEEESSDEENFEEAPLPPSPSRFKNFQPLVPKGRNVEQEPRIREILRESPREYSKEQKEVEDTKEISKDEVVALAIHHLERAYSLLNLLK